MAPDVRRHGQGQAPSTTTVLTTTDDRVGLNAFIAGGSPFYATGPNLARQVKDQNATLYGNLGMVQQPLGKSNVSGKGLMSISVKKDTKFPNASIALAQYFTNPRAMVEFSKQVPIYPSSPSAFDDPFFSSTPAAIEDSARPLAKDIIATYADIVPTIPAKADVNEIVRKAIESALFGGIRPPEGPLRRGGAGQRADQVGSSSSTRARSLRGRARAPGPTPS